MDNSFFKTIQHLRYYRELMLFGKLPVIGLEELGLTGDFLEKEYQDEMLDWPSGAPAFNPEAATWAAVLVFNAGQLMLHRDMNRDEMNKQLVIFPGEMSASVILSADLMCRFLPSMLNQLKLIDPEDVLIPALENIIRLFHYSAISYGWNEDQLDFSCIRSNPFMLNLYAERVMHFKKISLANRGCIKPVVKSSLGIYAPELWPEFAHQETLE